VTTETRIASCLVAVFPLSRIRSRAFATYRGSCFGSADPAMLSARTGGNLLLALNPVRLCENGARRLLHGWPHFPTVLTPMRATIGSWRAVNIVAAGVIQQGRTDNNRRCIASIGAPHGAVLSMMSNASLKYYGCQSVRQSHVLVLAGDCSVQLCQGLCKQGTVRLAHLCGACIQSFAVSFILGTVLSIFLLGIKPWGRVYSRPRM
jgi:hypothetical protein